MKKTKIREVMDELHREKMKMLISELIEEAIGALIKRKMDSKEMMDSLNQELLGAVKVIFKEDLELREHDSDNNHYFGFYLDDKLIFEYGYCEDEIEDDKTEHKTLN